MPTSLAISDISILAPDSSRHFIILKSASLRSLDAATDSSVTTILITVEGFRRSFNYKLFYDSIAYHLLHSRLYTL
jgi:hypothetical protein